ncbi:MAG TPA: GAF domain-containing protein [Candidatus Deferrimicrobiaceae bacterium]|nr:GAF domain-containing protein [Candidatus Deferrimicrobiaceae bacterium]
MSNEKTKSVLDEQTFGKLLEAAYLLQEHNRQVREMKLGLDEDREKTVQPEQEAERALKSAHAAEEDPRIVPDYALTLAEIVETQRQIQTRHLDADQAMALVCETAVRVAAGSGAAVATLEGKTIYYRACLGAAAPPLGTEVLLETALCATCVRNGEVLRLPNVNTASVIDSDLCRMRGIQSLIAVPIYHDGHTAGSLELYFDRLNGFAEQDIQTCQLMAGLVTEALGRDAGLELRKSMAAERSSMLAAIEKIKPNLAALASGQPAGRVVEAPRDQSAMTASKKADTAPASATESAACWKCSNALIDEEQFCGKCGAPRIGERDSSTLQSKLASALNMHQASQQLPFTPPPEHVLDFTEPSTDGIVEVDPIENAAEFAQAFSLPLLPEPMLEEEENNALPATSAIAEEAEESVPLPAFEELQAAPHNPDSTLALATQPEAPWSSAAKARSFLEALGQTRSPGAFVRFWRARRGDFYLAVAVILVLVAIRWGMLSNHSARATDGAPTAAGSALRRKPPADDLSLFDKLLINLGLAEAPEAPEYKYLGNPSTQVWIDTHTALYYCPGSELYGKTPKGRFTSQHEAQLDQFEPASRRACD